MRARRVGAAAAAALAGVLLGAAPAFADGTGGINLTVLGGGTSFHLAAAAHQTATGRFELTNVTGARQSVQMYAAQAAHGTGGWAVGGPGSAPWIALPAQTVSLAPHATRTFTFTIARDQAPWGVGPTDGAVVLAVAHGNVVARVATLVAFNRVGPPGVPSPAPKPPAVTRPAPAPVAPAAPMVRIAGGGIPWAAGVAAALVALLGGLVGWVSRRPHAAPAEHSPVPVGGR